MLQKLLGDFEDSNGNWARFMFVWQPLAASSMSTDGGNFDSPSLIAWLYEELDRTSSLAPKEYALTDDAFKLFSEAYNELEQRRIDPNTSPAMQNVWGKSEGRIGKIAINLHRTEAAFKGEIPSELIERHTIKAAIALTYFSAQQVQAIYTMLGSEDSLPPMLAKVLEIAERKGDWITARDIQFNFTHRKRPPAETVRVWFKELQALNLGEIQGEGRRIKFLFSNCGHCGSTVGKFPTVQSQTTQGIQPNVGNVGNFSEKSEKEKEDDDNEKEEDRFSKKAKNYPQYPQTDFSPDTERDTGVGSLPTNYPQYPQTDHKIKIGSTVKIHWAGSMRDGEIGTVLSIDDSGWATVRLHKKSLRQDLQIAYAPMAKKSGHEYYLELIE